MIGAYGSLLGLVAASVVVGLAVLSLAGRREPSWQAAPLGLATLLVGAGIAANAAPGIAPVALALAALTVASLVLLVIRRPAGLGPFLPAALPAALVAVLLASLPFIAAGRVGILGVGLVNDDMASHLLMSSWLAEGYSPKPVLIDQGYPLGPHALVAGLAEILGARQIDVFAGFALAIPALTAMAAFGALDRLGFAWRTLAATATALPYLVAAYLAQEAFKEPAMALFLLAFALWLPRVERARDGVVLGVLAAGTLYVYSFPGLAWLVGTAAVWGAVELVRRRGEGSTRALARRALGPAAVALLVAVALVVLDLDRLRDFADFRALDADRANEGGLGNLRGHISPLEALGVWPTGEFRLSAGAGSLPAAAFYAGSALALLALALGLPRWIRTHGWSVPAALAAAIAVYVATRGYGTVYTSAKALAVASSLITLLALGGLVADGGWRRLVAGLLVAGALLSSFLVLRQAPVGPEDHMDELAEFRPIVEGEPVLFLGRDNFVLYSLRGSKPFTHVRNFYDPYFVKPNFELEDVASKFDFDSVEAEKLDRFPYVITTRAAYASGPPVSYVPVRDTDSYILWRAGAVGARTPAETGAEPTGPLRCERPQQRSAGAVAAPKYTDRQEASAWSPSATIEDNSPASIELELPAGSFHISLQYDATRPLTLTAPGFEATLPGNLDYRGTAPFWPAGTVRLEGPSKLRVEASVEEPPPVARLLRANSVAHLGAIAATSASGGYVQAEAPYPGAGQSRGLVDCGDTADWVSAR
ncbi:MAG: hypothetical protein ACR2G3_09050 [Solirubrobacterales bacterium]